MSQTKSRKIPTRKILPLFSLLRCAAGWRGSDCGELDLAPAPSLSGAYQHPVNLSDCATSCGPSSWGGLPIKDENGTYHLFASQFVQNCTLGGWNPGCVYVLRAFARLGWVSAHARPFGDARACATDARSF